MQTLESRIEETALLVGILPHAEVRRLEQSMRTLTPDQQIFVRTALEQARMTGLASRRELALLEHLFDRWHTHNLAAKTVLIDRIEGLSGSGVWPDDPRPHGDGFELLSIRHAERQKSP